MIQDGLLSAEMVTFGASYTLGSNLPAIPILPGHGEEQFRLGLITQLPAGAEIQLGGPGLDESTIKVHSSGASYFVFLEDLNPQRKRAAWATAT